MGVTAPTAGVVGVPSLASRAVGATLEPVVFIVIAAAFGVIDYYLNAVTGGLGVSAFWISFWAMAIWSAWCWPAAQTFASSFSGNHIAMLDGRPASTVTIAAREFTRAGLLYGLPLLAIETNVVPVLVLMALAGFFISRTVDRRAPWDLLAGTIVVEDFGGPATMIERSEISSVADLQLDELRNRRNAVARRVVLSLGFTSVVVSVLIVWNIFSEAAEFFSAEDFSWSSLQGIGWFPRRGIFDVWTLFIGTLWITGIAISLAGPVGLGVAFYLSEYASPRVRQIIKPIIETLASIPSVVLGLFALSFITPQVLQPLDDSIGFASLLAAGLGVGILTVPIIASISEDAMRAVPNELREASYGLGGRRVTTSLRVVFPAALSGISAAFIVGISRAIGETMVVFIAAGGSGGAVLEYDVRQEGQTFTAAMASLGAGTDSVAGVGIAFQSLYALGALLFVITLLLNVLSDTIVRRFRQVY